MVPSYLNFGSHSESIVDSFFFAALGRAELELESFQAEINAQRLNTQKSENAKNYIALSKSFLLHFVSCCIYPWDLKFNHFLQTNADGDTTTTSATAPPAVGFPHSDVHFPIKKEFGKFLK